MASERNTSAGTNGAPPGPVPPAMRRSALERLVAGSGGPAGAAADRLLRAAASMGIDLGLLFASSAGGVARQVCLAVPGAGGTAMLFLSPPGAIGACGGAEEQASERGAVVRAALEGLRRARRFSLAQALPEPEEVWAQRAYEVGGMTRIGDLAYLRRPSGPVAAPEGGWPAGIEVVAMTEASEGELTRALERSYEGTLDCPGLCGMRSTAQVIESHRSTGVYDPRWWWVVRSGGQAEGCCLMSACPEHGSVELVYLGLSQAVRGRGLGRRVLEHALRAVQPLGARETTCAVDRANTPARRVYARLGFEEFTSRIAYVSGVGAQVVAG